MKRHCLAIRFFLAVAALTAAVSMTGYGRLLARGWTVDDVLSLESARDFKVSPDGHWVLWRKARPDAELNRYVSDLYLSSLTDSTRIQLTRGGRDDRSAQWSPDGKRIAFLGKNEKDSKYQIWITCAFGGEPERFTKLENGVERIAWQDETHLLFAAKEDSTLRERELSRKKDDTVIVGDQEHYPAVRLFRLDVTSKEIERLSENPGQITEFAVSPDGRWVVTNENVNVHFEYDYRIPPKQFLYDLEENSRREIFTEAHVNPQAYVWSLDSRGFYFTRAVASDTTDTFVSIPVLGYFTLGSMSWRLVDLGWERGLAAFERYHATKEGVLAALADGVRNRLAHYVKRGNNWKRYWIGNPDASNLRIGDVGPDGRTVIYTHSTASSSPRYLAATLRKGKLTREREFMKLNPFLKDRPIASSEVLTWVGAMGDTVEGILYHPVQPDSEGRSPLIALIHGGPGGADMDEFYQNWSFYPDLLANRGAFVLCVNYHGSGNYGLEWIESIKGHYYEYEVTDILNGIDHVLANYPADPERLGIMGWSNGSILAIKATIDSDRFKVLAAGAGDVNWTSDYGNCAFGAAFDNAYLGGPPWKLPDVYLAKSPLFKMEEVSTPTIIFFGTEDTNVPTQQGWEHYRALQQIGKVPVRFLLFPGEPHGLRLLSHQRRKMEEELSWFNRYLFGRDSLPSEVVKGNSPLDLLLKSRSFASVRGLYGKETSGALTPELVPWDSLLVGRFEVTRAQFHAFKPGYEYPPGTGNLPVSGVSFEDAEAYCEWLGQVLKKPIRLPAEKEMKRLVELGAKNAVSENNLDHWAGYSPTPGETRKLVDELEKLGGAAVLLKPVGSMPPAGDSGLYDLAGNVAEWCVAQGGRGKILGLSAVSPSDPRQAYSPPASDYVGFRVCAGVTRD